MQLFFDNESKRSNKLIAKQNVAEFKRPKRQKTWMLIFNIPSIPIVYYDYQVYSIWLIFLYYWFDSLTHSLVFYYRL